MVRCWNNYNVVEKLSFRLAKKLKMLKKEINVWNKVVSGRVQMKIKGTINDTGEQGGTWENCP